MLTHITPGPKVISRVISEPSIDELIEVIQRPPVIWDNLHANDYDQRRLFLGPYVGRSVGLIPKLNGVLTNPNCEYGANYIPIHTLAQWSHCGRNISRKSPPIKQSILLEVEGSGEGGRGDEESGILCLYEPTKALELSLKEWFSEFQIARKKPAHYKPVKNAESISKANDYETLGNGATKMDTSSSASLPPVASESMHMTSSLPSPSVEASSTLDPFTLDDMKLLVDYFYLPHKHGCKAVQILEEFCWLKENAPGYEVLKLHGHLKGHDEKEVEGVKTSPSGESGVASDGMRSDGETSESVVDDEYMTVSDVSEGGEEGGREGVGRRGEGGREGVGRRGEGEAGRGKEGGGRSREREGGGREKPGKGRRGEGEAGRGKEGGGRSREREGGRQRPERGRDRERGRGKY